MLFYDFFLSLEMLLVYVGFHLENYTFVTNIVAIPLSLFALDKIRDYSIYLFSNFLSQLPEVIYATLSMEIG